MKTNILKTFAKTITTEFLCATVMCGSVFCSSNENSLRPFQDDSIHQVSSEDEGFRWHKSLNFSINNNAVKEWYFLPVVQVDGRTIKADTTERRLLENNLRIDVNKGADDVHKHMSNIAYTLKTTCNCTNVAVSGLTVVVKDTADRYHACSKMLESADNLFLSGKVLCAKVGCESQNSDRFTNLGNCNPRRLTNELKCNLNKYQCSEGALITRIFFQNDQGTNFPSIVGNINALLRHLNNKSESKFKYDDIVLIVLHVHTTMDPCAKCTRLFASISRAMNSEHREGSFNKLLQEMFFTDIVNNPIIENLNSGKTRFLVSVSSNEHYSVNTGSGNVCSQAENSGRDAHYEKTHININTGTKLKFDNPEDIQLIIPYGPEANQNGSANQNWRFPASFPPYVIYARVGAETYRIHENSQGEKAPLNGPNSGCPTNSKEPTQVDIANIE